MLSNSMTCLSGVDPAQLLCFGDVFQPLCKVSVKCTSPLCITVTSDGGFINVGTCCSRQVF
ncbi:hypothetical protein JZ751_028703 [Albula glossodonta]|uniref:Uncharacterized protein n=1 Tax=Albula glossodonta TaxID=121402 RepID=A0A8T2NIM6_9TELE|nr:hypothetical protein JZ751_028703 [Albula glossodonta]